VGYSKINLKTIIMELLQLALSAKSGDCDPLSAYVELKKIEDELNQALKMVQPLAIDEAEKWKEKSFKYAGAIIEKKSAASRWDYSHIPAWQTAKSKLTYVEKIAQAGGGYDEETTEQIEKAVKIEGKSTIAVKLVKDEVNS